MEKRLWKKRKNLTPQSVQQDLDAFGAIKTADVDRLIRRYVKGTGGCKLSFAGNIFLTEQQFSSDLLYVNLGRCQIKDVAARMALIHQYFTVYGLGGTRISLFGMWRAGFRNGDRVCPE